MGLGQTVVGFILAHVQSSAIESKRNGCLVVQDVRMQEMRDAEMDLETADAIGFGQSLKGMGLNLLVRDVSRSVAVLTEVFDMRAFQPSADFAIMVSGSAVLQLHADHTYHANPLPALIPENGPRGGGLEIRLYDIDPDAAQARAQAHEGAQVFKAASNRPHGLREAYILDADRYCWVPSRPLNADEVEAVDA